jgi:hypothetical protein
MSNKPLCKKKGPYKVDLGYSYKERTREIIKKGDGHREGRGKRFSFNEDNGWR